jgi:uncharacterized coiled-coil DUF342 family protein
MSMTPGTPNFASVAKSFWNRPEGTTGKMFIVAGGVGLTIALVMGWGIIVPFLVSAMASTVELCMLIAAGVVITSPIWSKHVRLLVKNAFQLSMRWTTQLFIETDPIGMLRNNVDKLRKESQTFDTAVSQLAGSSQRLQDEIDNNKKDMMHQKSLADEVDRQVSIKQRQLPSLVGQAQQALQIEIEGLSLKKQSFMQAAGMDMGTIQNEQAVLDQTNKMYNQLTRLRNLAQFKVDALSQQADMLAKRRSAILASQKALKAAGAIINGDPAELAIVDQTVEYLNNEASDTIGQMSDFNQWSDKYLTDMDIQNGANAQDATKAFAAMEKKLSAPITLPGLPVITTVQDSSGTYIPTTSTSDDYANILK